MLKFEICFMSVTVWLGRDVILPQETMLETNMSTTVQQSHTADWVLMALSVAYLLSPVDIIPDIPIVGWEDDFFAIAVAGLNLLQGYASEGNSSLAQLLKFVKWAVIILGVICILLILLLGTLIVKLLSN